MSIPEPPTIPVESLDGRFSGRIATAEDPDWDAVRSAWNLSVDQRPAMVVFPESAEDIVAIVGFARRNGLRVAPQGTGHNASPIGYLADTILLRTDRMRDVTVDPLSHSVRVGAGALWSEVTAALAPHGLVARAGSAGSVGVVGFSVGGGYSWLSRRHGLAISAVTAVELVTGDGLFHRVDEASEPELFWAVRGGGANIGVITALEFGALAISEIYAGMLLFPMERAGEILAAYELWTRELDEAATTCVRLLRLPPMPELPELLRGKSFAAIDGAIDAPLDQAERLLAPLRELGPVLDTFARVPAGGLAMIHMDPPTPTPACGDGLILDELPPAAIDALLAVAGPAAESPLLAVDLRHLGGAIARPQPAGGAVDCLPGRFLLYAVGVTPGPDAARAVAESLAAVQRALAPWTGQRDYLNFREAALPAARFFGEDVLERLVQVQRENDPDSVIQSNHPLVLE